MYGLCRLLLDRGKKPVVVLGFNTADECFYIEEFKKLGFVFPKPSANFIFVSHPEYDAKELFEAMKAKGIYVRFWGSERIEQYLRVTIGTREEMEALFAFLREYMM